MTTRPARFAAISVAIARWDLESSAIQLRDLSERSPISRVNYEVSSSYFGDARDGRLLAPASGPSPVDADARDHFGDFMACDISRSHGRGSARDASLRAIADQDQKREPRERGCQILAASPVHAGWNANCNSRPTSVTNSEQDDP